MRRTPYAGVATESRTLLHRFKSAYHRFDSCANLFIFLQQVRTLGGQDVLALFKRTIFVLQPVANANQGVDAFFQSFEFVLEGRADAFSHS